MNDDDDGIILKQLKFKFNFKHEDEETTMMMMTTMNIVLLVNQSINLVNRPYFSAPSHSS